ncbi:MAG: cupin domain-containing protein, partial [Clostridia bacterium]|nr:cupin domain-containing protein [Clostridia bacterium]
MYENPAEIQDWLNSAHESTYHWKTRRQFICDDRDLPGGTSMPYFHTHELIEIFYVRKGHKRYVCDNDFSCDLLPGDLLIIPENIEHRTFSVTNEPQSRLILYFRRSYLDRFSAEIEKH